MSGSQHVATLVSRSRRSRILIFITLAYSLTWIVWSPLALTALDVWSVTAPQWLHLLGSLGPAIAGFILTGSEGKVALRELAKQGVSAPPRWVAVAIGIPVALFAVSALALLAIGSSIDVGAIGRSTEFPGWPIALYVLANVFFYGFGEEVGWRGYLLPRLPGGARSVRAVLTVALVWAVWHLPLFAFSAGMSSMGVAGALGWLASIVAGSLLTAELYTASRSVLVVALFHGVLDVFINSPVGGPLQSAMGALVTLAGFTAPIWVKWFVPRGSPLRD